MPTIRDDATMSASDATVDWIERQYETVDGMDMDGFLSFIAKEAQLRFGNNEPASGHDDYRTRRRDRHGSRIYGDMAPLYDVDPDETSLIC